MHDWGTSGGLTDELRETCSLLPPPVAALETVEAGLLFHSFGVRIGSGNAAVGGSPVGLGVGRAVDMDAVGAGTGRRACIEVPAGEMDGMALRG